VLDWGCGTAEYRSAVRDVLRHRYVGFDMTGTGADVRGDAHRLPFRPESFDHVITNSVLQYMGDPVAAVREVARVLRPGGLFSGSTAFLEPHAQRSHFHLTADGVLHVLRTAGFRVEAIWPQEDWLVYDSLAEMPGPVSGPTRWVLRRVAAFERLVGARRLHPREIETGRWLRRKTPRDRHVELLSLAGQIDFLAIKPASS